MLGEERVRGFDDEGEGRGLFDVPSAPIFLEKILEEAGMLKDKGACLSSKALKLYLAAGSNQSNEGDMLSSQVTHLRSYIRSPPFFR